MRIQFKAIISYYKTFVLWSFAINIIILCLDIKISIALMTKLILFLLLWFLMAQTEFKQKFTQHQTVKTSNIKLFISVFLIDSIITLPFLLLIKSFT